MPTVAHIVQKQVRALPQLEQFIERDLVSFHRLARHLRPVIERELGKEVEEGAIVMALSRLREKLGERRDTMSSSHAWGEISLSLRSGVSEIDLAKGPDTEERVHKLQSLLGGRADDVFNIVSGQFEMTIIASAQYEGKFLSALKGEKVIHLERGLSMLYLRFPKEVLYQPGFIDRVLRELAWENINVFEIISTLTELILVLKDGQVAHAYDVLRLQLDLKKKGQESGRKEGKK
ncbi:MAG: hypothetical protein V1728_05680 [Candidatus Micrarchaeota archaeon]